VGQPRHLLASVIPQRAERKLTQTFWRLRLYGTLTLQEVQHIIAIDGFSTTATMS